MSLETDGGSSTDCALETQKHSRKAYSREFLLSISQLEICKKLPSGFDELILSEFEDTSLVIQDCRRVPGSLPLQEFRRTDYSSSPPTRGDSSSYSRGNYGRWESRSSGWGHRDNDAQSDRDSGSTHDSGRRYGNQAQRTSRSSEHDGLLGSGTFPRPSAYASGTSASKVQASNSYHSNKTNEPYHPPRPYKAVPHPRKDTDAINDETFGSVECTSEDRVEEERRRRASFELMRKEQHKILREKQKSKLEKHKTEDIIELLEDNKGDRTFLDKNSEADGMTTQPSANSDLGKTSFPSQIPSARPRVPPGFKTTVLDKNSGSNVSHSRVTEVGQSDTEESLLEAKAYAAPNGILHSVERQSFQEISSSYKLEHRSSILKKNDQIANLSVKSDTSDRRLGMEDHFDRSATLLEAHEALDEPGIIEHSTQHSGSKFAKSSHDPSASILDKIFGNVIAVNVGDSEAPVMNRDSKPNDMLGSKAIQSSKFAQWFMEEDRKTTEDSSSSRPNDFLALVVGGDKTSSQAFDGNASKSFPSEYFNQSPEPTNKVTLHMSSAPVGVPEPMYDSSKREAAPSILTCEDLEHKMLLECSEKKPNLQPTSQVCDTNHLDTEEQPVNVDSNASQHLLSLLQKGPDFTNMTGEGSTTEARDEHDEFTVHDRSKEEDTRDSHASGKAVTLETLFGSAFMKELQSEQAPVSIQKNSVGSGLIDDSEARKSSLSGFDDGLFSSIIDGIGSKGGGKDNRFLPLNYSDQTKLDEPQNWLGFENSQYEVNSRRQNEMVSKSEAAEFHLPAENLFSACDHSNPQVSMVMPARILSKGDLTTGSVSGGDERSLMSLEGLPLPRVSYDQSEMPLHHRLAQSSSPQFHPLQMSQGRPLFHPMDSGPAHLNPQIFNGRESMALHEAPGRQFAGNMNRPPFRHPNGGLTGFDLPAHHPMLQQMHMAGNNPRHLLHDRLRGAQVPSHLSNQAANTMQEVNRIQGFPFVPHQVNISGRTVQMPDPDINSRNNHPEAMQRLVERQLGAPKQIHPFAGGNVQGMYSHELDMGLRYR